MAAAQAFEPGQAAKSLQIFSWHAVGTSAGPEASSQTAQAAVLGLSIFAIPMTKPTPWKQAADTPTAPGFSPSQAAKDSHAVGFEPQTEASAPPQQIGAVAHAVDLNGAVLPPITASHAAASLAADARCWAQARFTVSHVRELSPMVTVASLTKVALLAHTLGSVPQTETAPPQQAGAADHASVLSIIAIIPEPIFISHAAASLAAFGRCAFQKSSMFLHDNSSPPAPVAVAVLTKSASLTHTL